MPLLTIHHKTVYRYAHPVAFGEHRIMLRPRDGHDLRVLSGKLDITPEPMSLGGITPALAVANLALAHGSYIAPHQSGGPVATAVCLQLAACVPNFLIQEHFDAFNDPWTQDLVTWHPAIDQPSSPSATSATANRLNEMNATINNVAVRHNAPNQPRRYACLSCRNM